MGQRASTRRTLLLPDIVEDILSRLPVKSLIRFRCVCKPWQLLTYDPNFVDRHHKRAFQRTPALISPRVWCSSLTLCDLARPDCVVECPVDFGGQLQSIILSNSANGLICGFTLGRHENCYYLLNPSTRESLMLPKGSQVDRNALISLGVGFDASTGEYKVVRLYQHPSEPLCDVLTVGTRDEWRYVGKTPMCSPCFDPVFVNGAIYWVSYKDGNTFVLAFDVKDEKFQLVPIPERYESPLTVDLSTLGTDLCAGVRHHPYLTIWLLKDYKHPEWTKLYVIDEVGSIGYEGGKVLGIKDGKVLLLRNACTTNGILYTYDPRTNASVVISSNALGRLSLYAESLISPTNLLKPADALSVLCLF